MRIAFRSDASLDIGTGHVMRCLTLADALRAQGARCSFICRPHEGHLLDLIGQRGHLALALPALDDREHASDSPSGNAHAAWLGTDWAMDATDTKRILTHSLGNEPLDWLVVDHYALDHQWEQALRCSARRIMVIDDLADRPHDCDLLLDQNLGRTAEDYAGLLPPYATLLIGPQYALLRPEFAALRPYSLARRAHNPQLKRLLITMGGVDKDNVTGKVLDALTACALPPDLRITVVMGPHAPWLAEVRARAAQMPWATEVLVGVNNMAQLMADSDLAIGAAGSTSWERCCLGLPTIQVVLAENQKLIAHALVNAGAAMTADVARLAKDLLHYLTDILRSNKLKKYSDNAKTITGGRKSRRVFQLMEKLYEDHTLL
jgi:UDP-2,4-diacetamido-2,4,6-trideoxy-beta-L-altropyranose hydrolase